MLINANCEISVIRNYMSLLVISYQSNMRYGYFKHIPPKSNLVTHEGIYRSASQR